MDCKSYICLTIVISIFLNASAEQDYQRIARDLHNEYRSRHHVDPLSDSDDLNDRAGKCAQYYANKGEIDHSCPDKNGAGENLWAQWGGSPTDDDAARSSTDSWYSEVSMHDYSKDWQPASGHFTQLVWKSSNQIGFGTGRNGNMIVGCGLYNPHGNVLGEFKDNVFSP